MGHRDPASFETLLRQSYRRLLFRGTLLFALTAALAVSLLLLSEQSREGTERFLTDLRPGLIELRDQLRGASEEEVEKLLGGIQRQGFPIRLLSFRSAASTEDAFSGFGGSIAFLQDVPPAHLQWIDGGRRYSASPRRFVGETPEHWRVALRSAPEMGSILIEPNDSPLYALPSTRGGLHTLILRVDGNRGVALSVPQRPMTGTSLFQLGVIIFLIVAICGLLLFGVPALALGFYQARREAAELSAPLQAIASALSELGHAGEFRAPEGDLVSKEISELAVSLREIAGRLSAARTELESSRDELARNYTQQGQMLMNISHDLRTPLAAIRGYAEVLSRERPDSKAVAVINSECTAIVRLVDDLFELARIENAPLRLDPRPVVIRDALERVRDSFRGPAWDTGVLVCLGEMPNEVEGLLLVDSDRLAQILGNLVSNAIRHTPSGGYVELSAVRTSREMHISVADSGEGIAEEHLPRVFDRLYRADPARQSDVSPYRNAGLGLSIARGLAQRMGGDLSVRSKPGEGATFTLALPLDRAENQPDTIRPLNGDAAV
jgi:signal transduction histidine kinase